MINRILAPLGLTLQRLPRHTPDFLARYERQLSAISRPGVAVHREPYDESGLHPANYITAECAFVARQLRNIRPDTLLDVGSYRQFVLGLLAQRKVTTLDVRDREPATPDETVVTTDSKEIGLPNASFDCIISMCSLEHFGLGRYGDEFDPEGDAKAFREWRRLLKPGGYMVFTTTITRGGPQIAFNAHRIYSRGQLGEFVRRMELVEEAYYNPALERLCSFEELSDAPAVYNVYMGCFKSPAP